MSEAVRLKSVCKGLSWLALGLTAAGAWAAGSGTLDRAADAQDSADERRRAGWVIKETEVQLQVPLRVSGLDRQVAKACARCTVTADNYLTLPGGTTRVDNAKTEQACVGTVGGAVDAAVTLNFRWAPDGQPLTPDGASAPFTYVCDLLLEHQDGSLADPAKGGPEWSRPAGNKPKHLKSRGRF